MAKFPLVFVAAFLVFVQFSYGKPQVDPEQATFAKLSGRELVQLLAENAKRPRAFYELARRAEPGEYADFSTFESKHYNLHLLICLQEQSRPPIYLVLYGFINLSESIGDGYRVDKASELFAAITDSGIEEEEPAIQAFNSEGKQVKPFGGNDVLRQGGTLADINKDGLVERVDTENYGSEFNNATVLMVSAVKTKAQPLLTVVINWGGDEWTFRVADRDGDGISEIEAGPRTAAGLIPKAVWKWDAAKRAYVGPSGNEGEHFRVINGAATRKELGRLKAAKLTFPKDADAISANSLSSEETAGLTPSATPSATPSEAYHFTSLKGAPDEELLRFMSRGKSEWERESENRIRERLPANFWKLDAKTAALALVAANRTDYHRAHYQIAIDDRDKAEPPVRCSIAFEAVSPRDYEAVEHHYFLRVDPDDSYLTLAGSSSGGVVFYNAVFDQPVYDMRICQLPYDNARKIAQVIWWLDRVRSRVVRTDPRNSMSGSSADWSGHLVMRVKDRPMIDYAKIWSGLARWTNDYTPETFLNFAAFLISDALPARLGKQWSQFEPTEQRPSELREESAPVYTAAEKKRLQDFSDRFLSWFSPQQERISFSIVTVAAQFAGSFGIVADASRLREIEVALPSPAPPKRSDSEVRADLDKLPWPFDVKNPKERKRVEQQRAVLDVERDAIFYEDVSGSPDLLRNALAAARRRLEAAGDPEKLGALAISNSPEQQWALQCLAEVDRKRYADALESWVRKATKNWPRQFFAELVRVDPARAATLAREMPPDKIGTLTISAFVLLQKAGAVPDENQRLTTVINILHDPKTDWEERAAAVHALVPPNEPLRYPGNDIDEALLKLFDGEQADNSLSFARSEACQALALRGRTEYFDRIVHEVEATPDVLGFDSALEALTLLAQHDASRFNSRLAAIIKPHLFHTNKSVPGLIWAIWGADVRQLQPDLDHLATHDADEYEDIKASSSGGNASDVTGRFHLARKIVNLWTETDPLTQARLLVAFGAGEAEELFRNPHPERLARMKKEMNRIADKLSAEEKADLLTFATKIDSMPGIVDDGRVDPEMLHKVTAFARNELHL